TIASSSKFAGPTEPPSTWYASGDKIVNANSSAAIATPASGTALVIQSVSYGWGGGIGAGTYASVGLFSDTQGDNCAHSLSPGGGYFELISLPMQNTLMKNFQPGLVVPGGEELCALVVNAEVVISLIGYNIPAKTVSSPAAQPRA